MENNLNNNMSNEELKKEIERKRFLENLEQKEIELATQTNNKNEYIIKNAKKAFKKKVIRTIITFCLLVVFCFCLSRLFYTLANSITNGTSESINTSIVEIAIINYKRDKGTLPIDVDNKVNVSLLRQLGYLSSDVENNCDCYFYLKDKNGIVETIKRK